MTKGRGSCQQRDLVVRMSRCIGSNWASRRERRRIIGRILAFRSGKKSILRNWDFGRGRSIGGDRGIR